jgi:nucleotide-binding universal stress UspA family protein
VWLVNDSTEHVDRVVAAVSTLEETQQHRQLDDRVLLQARDLSVALGLPLHVVSVIPDWLTSPVMIAPVPSMSGHIPYQLAELGEQALARATDILHDILRRGLVHIEVANAVGANGVLVIGSKAARALPGKVAERLLGTTSEKVIHHVLGDVLVVH